VKFSSTLCNFDIKGLLQKEAYSEQHKLPFPLLENALQKIHLNVWNNETQVMKMLTFTAAWSRITFNR